MPQISRGKFDRLRRATAGFTTSGCHIQFGPPAPEFAGRKAADTVHRCMNELRSVASNGGAYVSETNFLESDFGHSYWGANHARLAQIKQKYDPDGLFFVHNGVGSEQWTPDGFTRL
jgi:hypothetical protein